MVWIGCLKLLGCSNIVQGLKNTGFLVLIWKGSGRKPNVILVFLEFTKRTERSLTLFTLLSLSLPSDLRDRLRASLDKLCSLTGRSLEDDAAFVTSRNLFLESMHDFSARLSNWYKDGEALQQSLGLHGDLNVRRLRQLLRIEQICESEDRPDESWLEITKLRDVSQSLPSIRERFEKRNRERRSLFTEYEAAVLELDNKDLIEKFSGPYASFFRIFRPGYYKSRGQIKRLAKMGSFPRPSWPTCEKYKA